MPFLTEEIWQNSKERKTSDALIVSSWPEKKEFDQDLVLGFETAAEVVSGIRGLRKQKNIAHKETLELSVLNNEAFPDKFDSLIIKLGNLSTLDYVENKLEGALSFRVKSNEYFIPLQGAIDIEAEKEKLKEELAYNQGFLKSVEKKLSNQRFVSNAPEKVVEIERKKKADAEAKIETIRKSLEVLRD